MFFDNYIPTTILGSEMAKRAPFGSSKEGVIGDALATGPIQGIAPQIWQDPRVPKNLGPLLGTLTDKQVGVNPTGNINVW